ncbi:MAG: glycerophosphodiester phosphodiesterase family protein [Verrucomicrobiota bacterium]
MIPFLCIGHRGARGHEPENTLRSIGRAFELGADGVEIDVWLIDGQLIVLHDATLQRTTNGHGPAKRYTFEQLRTLDAGLGERIPLLREVLDLVNRRGVVNIELKGPGTAYAVCQMIEEFVRNHGWSYEQFIVSSFRRRELKQITAPSIRIGMLCVRPTPLYYLSARRLKAFSVHPAASATKARFVEDAHRRGLKVFPYTVNTPEEIARMRHLKVDGVFTDYPDRVCTARCPT